jgi:hypothetical protein
MVTNYKIFKVHFKQLDAARPYKLLASDLNLKLNWYTNTIRPIYDHFNFASTLKQDNFISAR